MLGSSLTKVLGLELYHDGHQHYSCRYCELERKGDELQITGKKIVEGNLVKVLEALRRELPVALVLSGKGFIHKNISITAEDKDTHIFRQAFPSIEVDDFFIQQYRHELSYCLSISRREMVQELIEKLKRAGLEIYSVGFGGLVAVHVFPQLNLYGEELQFDGHRFELTAKQFKAYRYEAGLQAVFPLKIGEEPLAEELIVAYSAAFQLVLHDKLSMVKAAIPAIDEYFERYRQTATWKKRALYFLLGLFGLLLISFALFSHYNEENEKLLRDVGAQTASTDQMELLGQNIAKQEKLLKQLGWNGGYNYGFLVNEIGSSMPRQLTLLQLNMNDFRSEQEKTERFPNIKIKGGTTNLTAVNNWIFVLREKPWVKSAKLVKFQEEQDSESYQFDILINY